MENYRGHNMVFIVGSPRSGTTWLQRLLAGHPAVRTGQESDVFDQYIGPQLQAWRKSINPAQQVRGGLGLGCYLTDSQFMAILHQYAWNLLQPIVGGLQPGELFVEKTPSHALFIPEIHELLPESKIIHVLRDGRDVIASMLAASKSWGASWAPRDVRSAVSMWVGHVRTVQQDAERLPPGQFYEVRYEDLHAGTADVLAGVIRFLGLTWSQADLLKVVDHNRPEVARKGGGTGIPMGGEFGKTAGSMVKEPEAFVRKARAGSWREDLSLVEKVVAWRAFRKTLAAFGYPWTYPWTAD